MSATIDTSAFDRVLDPIFQLLTVEQATAILEYRADDSLQARMEELAEKNTEGAITDAERSELEAYSRANNFIALLKAKIRRMMSMR